MSLSKATMDVRSLGNRVSVIDISGEVNAFAESALMDAFNQATTNDTKYVIMNFSGLDYMNSSGIGLLVTMLIRARRMGVRLLACGLSEHYQQIFELTRLNEAISIYSNEEEALQAVKVAA